MKKCLLLIFASALFSSGCEVGVVSSVPPEVVETRPAPPFADAVWIGGEYRWRSNQYVLVPGRWERPRGVWVSGHWQQSRRGYRWRGGHWR